jgi:phosphatidylglycerophosphatase GEP4
MKYSMSQSINVKAIVTLVTSVLHRPNLIVPHLSVPTISSVDFASLRDHCGIRAIIFDKDNTLTAPYEMNLHSKAVLGVEESIRVFGTEKISILSNSAGTMGEDDNMNEARQTELALGIPVIRHKEKKPSKFHATSSFVLDDYSD